MFLIYFTHNSYPSSISRGGDTMVRQELSAETNLEGNGRGLLQGTSEVRLETLITTECQKSPRRPQKAEPQQV